VKEKQEKLIIDKLGPIKHLEIEPRPLTILIGEQASGKSLAAQVLYFFRGLRLHSAKYSISQIRSRFLARHPGGGRNDDPRFWRVIHAAPNLRKGSLNAPFRKYGHGSRGARWNRQDAGPTEQPQAGTPMEIPYLRTGVLTSNDAVSVGHRILRLLPEMPLLPYGEEISKWGALQGNPEVAPSEGVAAHPLQM
jgi:hypothetical protein